MGQRLHDHGAVQAVSMGQRPHDRIHVLAFTRTCVTDVNSPQVAGAPPLPRGLAGKGTQLPALSRQPSANPNPNPNPNPCRGCHLLQATDPKRPKLLQEGGVFHDKGENHDWTGEWAVAAWPYKLLLLPILRTQMQPDSPEFHKLRNWKLCYLVSVVTCILSDYQKKEIPEIVDIKASLDVALSALSLSLPLGQALWYGCLLSQSSQCVAQLPLGSGHYRPPMGFSGLPLPWPSPTGPLPLDLPGGSQLAAWLTKHSYARPVCAVAVCLVWWRTRSARAT